MVFPSDLIYEGANKEFRFRDEFVMPLLMKLGFATVVNYHGQKEFGRDVIFADSDRFGHPVYYGIQVKYEASISQTASHELVNDAIEATTHPFKHPGTGSEGYISCFYVANAGTFSDNARENYFTLTRKKGIRDSRLLDGNALLLLDKTAFLNRGGFIRERLTGLLLEIHYNEAIANKLPVNIEAFVKTGGGYPAHRYRYAATEAYLATPHAIPGLEIEQVSQYWETIRIANMMADSLRSVFTRVEDGGKTVEAVKVVSANLIATGALIQYHLVPFLQEMGFHRGSSRLMAGK